MHGVKILTNSPQELNECERGAGVPILREGELDIISYSAEQTLRLGTRLGSLLKPGDLICLSGDMGAGKTVFSIGIGRGWGAAAALTSPTFNIVHEHRRSSDDQRLYHIDCYRLHGPGDAESIGLDELLGGDGALVIEWPEHIAALLPPERLWIDLRILEPTRRNFTFAATGRRYEDLIAQFRGLSFGT
jgi:tRNA threonylcarbamoyladenosine biosynthesis protein TsaE